MESKLKADIEKISKFIKDDKVLSTLANNNPTVNKEEFVDMIMKFADNKHKLTEIAQDDDDRDGFMSLFMINTKKENGTNTPQKVVQQSPSQQQPQINPSLMLSDRSKKYSVDSITTNDIKMTDNSFQEVHNIEDSRTPSPNFDEDFVSITHESTQQSVLISSPVRNSQRKSTIQSVTPEKITYVSKQQPKIMPSGVMTRSKEKQNGPVKRTRSPQIITIDDTEPKPKRGPKTITKPILDRTNIPDEEVPIFEHELQIARRSVHRIHENIRLCRYSGFGNYIAVVSDTEVQAFQWFEKFEKEHDKHFSIDSAECWVLSVYVDIKTPIDTLEIDKTGRIWFLSAGTNVLYLVKRKGGASVRTECFQQYKLNDKEVVARPESKEDAIVTSGALYPHDINFAIIGFSTGDITVAHFMDGIPRCSIKKQFTDSIVSMSVLPLSIEGAELTLVAYTYDNGRLGLQMLERSKKNTCFTFSPVDATMFNDGWPQKLDITPRVHLRPNSTSQMVILRKDEIILYDYDSLDFEKMTIPYASDVCFNYTGEYIICGDCNGKVRVIHVTKEFKFGQVDVYQVDSPISTICANPTLEKQFCLGTRKGDLIVIDFK
jgi:hypothetical protein